MKYLQHASMAVIAFLCLLLPLSCSRENPAAPTPSTMIQLKTSAALGNYLTDKDGNTLYYFSNDFNGLSNCTGGCLDVWPIFYAGDNLAQTNLPAGLDIADFGSVTTAAGTKQTTYKTWPLYYYAPVVGGTNTREAAGETKGEGVNNVWYVAKPDYTVMILNAQLIGNNGVSYKSDYSAGTGKTVYFTDGKGVTLYGFAPDSFNINKYTKADFSNNPAWPIYETDKVIAPSTLDKTLFGYATVFGKKQLTYKGWPMYYFGPDSLMRGRNKGVSVPRPGVWPVMVKDAPVAPR